MVVFVLSMKVGHEEGESLYYTDLMLAYSDHWTKTACDGQQFCDVWCLPQRFLILYARLIFNIQDLRPGLDFTTGKFLSSKSKWLWPSDLETINILKLTYIYNNNQSLEPSE